MAALNTLRRSSQQKIIAGVCGGVAEWLGWNAAVVRALFIIGSFVPLIPGFVVYLVLWALVPKGRPPE